MDVFLQPGEVYFGDAETRIRTVLGSCVAVTLWHPQLRIGGMCHFMLPNRRRRPADAALNGKYADEALQLLEAELMRAGTAPVAYEAKLFGGGNMFEREVPQRSVDVSGKNVNAGRLLLEQRGFRVCAEDLGGPGHRQIIFDIGNGAVWVRRHPLPPAPARKR